MEKRDDGDGNRPELENLSCDGIPDRGRSERAGVT